MKFETWGSSRCRTCLNYSSDTTSIEEKLSFDDHRVIITIAELIKECASVELLTDDTKPQTICKVCVESARITYTFRKRCIESQLILMQEHPETNVEVKLEYDFTADDTYSSEDEKPLARVLSNTGVRVRKNSISKIRKHRKGIVFEKRKKDHNCSFCSKTYKSPKLLLLHIKRHNDPRSKIYTGSTNDEKPTEAELSANLRLASDSEDIKRSSFTPDIEGNYKCSVCNRIFNTSRNLLIHSKRHSDQNTTQRFKRKHKLPSLKDSHDNKDITINNSSPKDVSNAFNCTVCNKNFSLHKYLVKHLKRHQASGRLSISNFDKKLVNEADLNALGKCCFCDWTGTSNELKKHKEEHSHLKTFKCHLCDKKFFESYNLQTHLLIHSGEKKHMCDFCGKSFTAKTNLKMHLRTHTGSKPYGCELCEKTFAQQSQLTSHMFTHSQDRNYVCSLCGVTFKRKGSLRDHIRCHRPVEEWDKCPVCAKPFRTQKQLKEHMHQHTGERNHVCNVCGKDFGRKRNLSTHMKIHTGESTHVCLVCGRAFSQKHVLLSHMKTHEK